MRKLFSVRLNRFLGASVTGLVALLRFTPSFSSAPVVLASCSVLVAVALLGAATVEAKRSYDLPRGDAATTLRQFAAAAGKSLVFVTDKVRGETTNAVRGEFTPREALDRMLAGSALEAAQDAASGALVVSRQRTASRPAREGEAGPVSDPQPQPKTKVMKSPRTLRNPLALLTVWISLVFGPAPATHAADGSPSSTPESKKDTPLVLSIFKVTADKDEGYRSSQTVSGSRTVENLRDIPNSISILNRELMDDLNATTVAELSAFALTGEVSDATDSTVPFYVFRGIVSNTPLRNGIVWFAPLDTYSIDRVELLRGPNAFLYGEGTAGGSVNQLTKQAASYNFNKLNLMFGSHNLYRGELDVNRKLNDKLAVRVSLAYQNSDSFVNHTERQFAGGYLAVSYNPFKNTSIDVNLEAGKNHEVRADTILLDAFSTTQRTGATAAYTTALGGVTLIPATGQIINTVGTRRSAGTNIIVTDESVLPSDFNFYGPNAFHDVDYSAVNINFAQKIGDNLSI